MDQNGHYCWWNYFSVKLPTHDCILLLLWLLKISRWQFLAMTIVIYASIVIHFIAFFRYGWMMMPLSCVEVRGKDWRKFNASWEWNWYRKKWFFMTFLFKINSRGWVSSCRIRKFRWGFFCWSFFRCYMQCNLIL